MNFKGFLIYSFLLFSSPIYAVTIEGVNDAYEAIQSELKSEVPILELNVQQLQKHIDTLKIATNEMEFDVTNFSRILLAKLRAAELINKKYLFSKQPIDVSQVQGFLDDLERLRDRTGDNLNSLEFTAGHIAAHQLQNQAIAYRYWLSCGNKGHAGCMNILASSYESGEFVVEQDLDKAVTWHKRVVDTGTRWGCAGVFSSLRLAILSSSGVNTKKSTEYWLDTLTELREKRADESENTNACEPYSEYIARYTMSGFENKWLDKLTSVEVSQNDPTYSGRAEWNASFASVHTLNTLKPILSVMYDDTWRCEAVEQYAFKVKGDPVELENIYNYLSTLDPEHCAKYLSTVVRLNEMTTM